VAEGPFAGFPAFAPAFEPGALDVGAYLVLLNLGEQSGDAVRVVADCLENASNKRDQIGNMLVGQLGWRAQLVGCVAILAAERGERPLDRLLDAASSGSWVSPQLLATLTLLDPPDWVPRVEAAIVERGDAKAAAALREVSGKASARIAELADADVDDGGDILRRWRGRIASAFDDARVRRSWADPQADARGTSQRSATKGANSGQGPD
jgi:hypothetical protein